MRIDELRRRFCEWSVSCLNGAAACSKRFVERVGTGGARIWRTVRPVLVDFGQRLCDIAETAGKAIAKGCKRAWRFIVSIISIYFRKNAARSAAQFSFNIILTIFPLLICINWLVSLLHGNYNDAIEVLSDFVPQTALTILTDYIDYLSANSSPALFYAGLFMMLMPSSAALRSLQGILIDIQNRGRRGGDVWQFILSFVFSIVFLLVVYACMIILFTGSRLLNFLVEQFDFGRSILGWNWLRFFVLFFLVFFLLYLLYRFLPFTVKKPRHVFRGRVYPGVIFSSIALVAVSIVFSWFISLSTRYSLVYGSLASVVIMMLWLYTCSNIIIVGGIVNRVCNNLSRHIYA